MTDDDEVPDYFEELEDIDPELGSAQDLYEEITDDQGLAEGYEHLEPDPERWAVVLQHDRFRDSITQFDDLMGDYDHFTELHVGPDSFRQLNHESQSLPDELNFYIAEDREEFIQDVNHPLFSELDDGPGFTVPKGSNIGLAFGGYRDTVDVEEDFEYLDVRIPTSLAHSDKALEKAFAEATEAYKNSVTDVKEDYADTLGTFENYLQDQ